LCPCDTTNPRGFEKRPREKLWPGHPMMTRSSRRVRREKSLRGSSGRESRSGRQADRGEVVKSGTCWAGESHQVSKKAPLTKKKNRGPSGRDPEKVQAYLRKSTSENGGLTISADQSKSDEYG